MNVPSTKLSLDSTASGIWDKNGTVPQGVDIRLIPLASLIIDGSYQRSIDEPRARQIAAQWDDLIAGAIMVNERPNGVLAVVDGQHRVRAAILAKGEDADILCAVSHGLPIEAEARLFAELNGPLRRQPKALDVFRARLVAGDQAPAEIVRTVEDVGLRIGFNAGGSSEPDVIQAIVAIERIYRRAGVRGLRATLVLIRDIWRDQEPRAYIETMLYGAFWFLSSYPQFEFDGPDREHLLEKLALVQPTTLQRRAQTWVQSGAARYVPQQIAEAMRAQFNAGKRSRHLPPLETLSGRALAMRWGMTPDLGGQTPPSQGDARSETPVRGRGKRP
jgi:hypothetical protein